MVAHHCRRSMHTSLGLSATLICKTHVRLGSILQCPFCLRRQSHLTRTAWSLMDSKGCVHQSAIWLLAGDLQLKCRKTCDDDFKTCGAFDKALVTRPVNRDASTDAKTRSSFWFQPPLGRYHEGACVLKGTDRSYVLAPFHKIVEDRYTVYFDVRHS